VAVTPTSVLGKYRIIREIARSNDIVYEGVDPAMGRRVAIKELSLPQHLAGSQKRERIERFYREAKAAGTLTHPNIVTIYDVGEENERHYIVMEYLEGHSLREIQQMQGALPLKESLEIALQLCDALGYAHSRGVVHRDVKPDNVHILPGGIIKLTDFGIARITAEPSITAHGQVFGTPSYMSPEQVASHTVDHRTDIFSLGITLYEMLTGRKPFQGDSVITITYNIMNIQPPMPVGVPPGLHAILQKALAKDVNMRYQNAAQMAADLRGEKYTLETGNRTAQIPAMPMGQSTLNTGNVPPEISGIPAFAPQQPAYGQPPYVPQPQYTPQPQGQQYGRAPAPGAYPQQPSHYPQQGQSGQYGQPTGYPQQPPYGAPQYGAPQRNFGPQSSQGRGDSRAWFSPELRRNLVLALTIIGMAFLLVLLVWGIIAISQSFIQTKQRAQGTRFLQQGVDAYNHKEYDQAAIAYSAARRYLPPGSKEDDQAAEGLSAVEVAKGLDSGQHNDTQAAENAYNEAIKLYPKNAAAYELLGNLKSVQGDPITALREWQYAIQFDHDGNKQYATIARHNSALTDLSLAQQSLRTGDTSQARRYWQLTVDVDPGSEAANRASVNLSSPTPAGTPGTATNDEPTTTPIASGQ